MGLEPDVPAGPFALKRLVGWPFWIPVRDWVIDGPWPREQHMSSPVTPRRHTPMEGVSLPSFIINVFIIEFAIRARPFYPYGEYTVC